jgi:predicted RNA-binding Zn-ribbon protein involved in translation (DUF1610 family)
VADEPTEPCPNCGSTDIDTQAERFRAWVLDANCRTCSHNWKQSN